MRLCRRRPRPWPASWTIAGELGLRDIATAAGLAPDVVERLSSHSFRVGAAQELAVEGRSIFEIMRAGRWKSVDALADYLRDTPMNIWSHTPNC